jgi:hypothetical protein
MKNHRIQHPTSRLISGPLMAILAVVMTGCPLLEPPEALKPLEVEKTDKFAFKTVNPVGSACRITMDANYGKYVYDYQGRLYQYVTFYDGTITFYYDNESYLVSQEQVFNNGTKSIRKYYYNEGMLSKIEQSYNSDIGVYSFELQFESGILKVLRSNTIGGNELISRSFKTDAKGRIIELPTGGFQNGIEVIDYFEYDTKGNLAKIYNDAPQYPRMEVFRYDDKPNPLYQVARFKGHPETRVLDYLGASIANPSGLRFYKQPNNMIYSETTVWNFVTNTPQKSVQTWDLNYNAAGYPVSFNAISLGKPDVLRWGDYENCN